MNYHALRNLLSIVVLFVLFRCGSNVEEKGFAVSSLRKRGDAGPGISNDSLTFGTRPSNVLLTGIAKYRLTTIYKVNYNDDSVSYIGSNAFHYNYEENGDENHWHGNYIPGLSAVYGFNMVNVSLYDGESRSQKNLFSNPALIKTVYYPAFSKDTLNNIPVQRRYFLISVYDDDTNKDGFINPTDLRRFYHFDLSGVNRGSIIPKNYSVSKSEYDPANDVIFVFAALDVNADGKIDKDEPTHVFWVDLKNPEITGREY
jgi:hypothetical protein